jgi:hypothetical protein
MGLVHKKTKIVADTLFQADIHGLDKMFLSHAEILEVTVNQRFKLALFFEKKFQHGKLRQHVFWLKAI